MSAIAATLRRTFPHFLRTGINLILNTENLELLGQGYSVFEVDFVFFEVSLNVFEVSLGVFEVSLDVSGVSLGNSDICRSVLRAAWDTLSL